MNTGPPWRKSSHSGGDESNCVEVTHFNGHIAVRDSKAPESGHLTLTRQYFADLLARLGELA
ncbi:protein of unknown function [Actinomadura meyerae]|uniref:DUF397 domain-containing protein n=1 Tax=Actinomadura meyerae TaxID=240840 RepID=A0A239P7I1_9ACTN|nr:DUF397 domain-containing protein [Actinomadura meyerae]SNT63001.1 protein of unknown function [Actinomadura meyerae]